MSPRVHSSKVILGYRLGHDDKVSYNAKQDKHYFFCEETLQR